MKNKTNPVPHDFSDWKTIHNFKNYFNDDTMLDWLDMYGIDKGHKKDVNNKDTHFNNYLQQRSNTCKEQVIYRISSEIIDKINHNHNHTHTNIIPIIDIPTNTTIEERYNYTVECMKKETILIINPVLLDKLNKLISTPNLLINATYIPYIFNNSNKQPNAFININTKTSQSSLQSSLQYIPIDITTLKLNTSKTNERLLLNSNKIIQLLKVKLIISNLCISNILFNLNGKNNKNNNKNCHEGYVIAGNLYLEKFKEINSDNITKKRKRCNTLIKIDDFCIINTKNNHQDIIIKKKIFLCIKWLNKLKKYGHCWNISTPNCMELYPTMTNKDDYPWKTVKKNIAVQLNEITLLWGCGKKERDIAHKNNIKDWRNCTASLFYNNDSLNTTILNKMIQVNKQKDDNHQVIYPSKIQKQTSMDCITKNQLEFYVDFETLYNFNNSSNMIFMIGCISHYRVNKFTNRYRTEFKCFVAKNLKQETKIINEWISYMKKIQQQYGIVNTLPPIYHWSNAEPTIYKNYLQKNNYKEFNKLNFCDLLQVFKLEPIIIKGAFSYGLKDISKALYSHGMIKTTWDTKNISDGKVAMFEAWRYYNGLVHQNTMEEIKRYNYIDCKVMQEIIEYLRNMT
jgi:hypothetical protein